MNSDLFQEALVIAFKAFKEQNYKPDRIINFLEKLNDRGRLVIGLEEIKGKFIKIYGEEIPYVLKLLPDLFRAKFTEKEIFKLHEEITSGIEPIRIFQSLPIALASIIEKTNAIVCGPPGRMILHE